jgi:hypothetical protein
MGARPFGYALGGLWGGLWRAKGWRIGFALYSPKNILFMNFVHTFLVGHTIDKTSQTKNGEKGA